jgi:hypothetical protein
MNPETPQEKLTSEIYATEAQWIEPQQVGVDQARRAATHRFQQTVGHPRGERASVLFGKNGVRLEIEAERGGEAAPGFFEPLDMPRFVNHDKPGADVEGGHVGYLALSADRYFRRAASDIDVHDRRAIANRARHRAGAVSCHDRFQSVAGADRDHSPGLSGKQIADAPRIAPPHATPVRMSAPVSISSGSTLASLYWRSMKAPSASASILSSAE